MKIKFIDMFAGIGGFHQAVKRVCPESKCIQAIEFDKYAAQVYEDTYGIVPLGDIKDPDVLKEIDRSMPPNNGFNMLFAGFPCQTFSKAGKQEGFQDETRGTLFYSIKEMLKEYTPGYFVLENVRNLLSHRSGEKKTFDIMQNYLRELGYEVRYNVLSPHRMKNTKYQMRERVFIYGVYKGNEERLDEIHNSIESYFHSNSEASKQSDNQEKNYITKYIDKNNSEIKNRYLLDEEKATILKVWNELVVEFKSNHRVLMSPIWLDVIFNEDNHKSDLEWKSKLITKNLDFYKENKDIIYPWYIRNNKLMGFSTSNRKFEWNANNSIKSIYEGITQFRPSGIRVKKPNFFPTFVAINHKAIIGKEPRYLMPSEIEELYGFKGLKLGDNESQSYKQLGNTISVDVAEIVIKELLRER